MDFDLQAHIRQVLLRTDAEDIATMAQAVYDATSINDVASGYRQALPVLIRTLIGDIPRQDSRSGHVSPDTHTIPAGPGTNSLLNQATSDTHARTVEQGSNTDDGRAIPGPAPTGSPPPVVGPSRIARFRAARWKMRVGVGDTIYRNILDCTLDDLIYAAKMSENHAARNAHRAAQYWRLVDKMKDAGADKVADLSDEEIGEVLNDE